MKTGPERNPHEDPAHEAELVRAAQGGDQAAFTEIVKRYQRAVYRLGYGLTRNAADADDLSQETFVRAYRALERFRAGEPLYPWLSRITMNLAFSLHRYRRRRPETSIEPLIEAGQQWGVDDDPGEHAAEREQRESLQACFAELSDEHQAVLGLRVLQDMSYEQIAETLNVPIGTVMSRLSRARVELKRRMTERGTGPAMTPKRRGEAS
jgi:RNA polymerase sigma-70 factor (ECF subfamily)